MKISKLNTKARKEFRRALAINTPVIDGRDSKILAKEMGYETDLLQRVITEVPIPFEPRETYPSRLQKWIHDQTS